MMDVKAHIQDVEVLSGEDLSGIEAIYAPGWYVVFEVHGESQEEGPFPNKEDADARRDELVRERLSEGPAIGGAG